jgi:NADH:ubiquinone oxidoreductase subunit F (NADH-binding)/NADH:ubiquinone oxidoreductase subunit E
MNSPLDKLMQSHSVRYWKTHHGTSSPLLQVREAISQKHGNLNAEEVRELSRHLGIPESTVISIISYYSDLHGPSQAWRICRGTSCNLAGAEKLQSMLERQARCREVYCLGHCYQGPAALNETDQVLVGGELINVGNATEPKHRPPATPSIRCLAKRAIVTKRAAREVYTLEQAQAEGVYSSFFRCLNDPPIKIIEALEQAGERGRGGAGFSTGKKWRSCAEFRAERRYVIANGDEGDPGSFIDRVLLENDPHGVIEGILLCAYAVGATQAIVFIRSEYPKAIQRMQSAICAAYNAGILGPDATYPLEISIFPGMGSYVCGEETAMLNAIEGLRGEVRIRPPYPAQTGLYGKPTVVNNVETLVNVAAIIAGGAQAYAALGTQTSAGTKAMCLDHGFAQPGIVEVEFGITIRELIDSAGGAANGEPLEAVILGGPMGSLLLPDQWDVEICYGAMAKSGIQLGHGGLVALQTGTNYRMLLEQWLKFMIDESCGKCTPCRLGPNQALITLQDDKIIEDTKKEKMTKLLGVIEQSSLCAFGQYMPSPIRKLIEVFGDRIFDQGDGK